MASRFRNAYICILFIIIAIFFVLSIKSFLNLDIFEENRCDISFYRPSYYRLINLRDDERIPEDFHMTGFAKDKKSGPWSRLRNKYTLYLYKELEDFKALDTILDANYTTIQSLNLLNGWPVLFIHGHAGSFKQVRIFANEGHRQDFPNRISSPPPLFPSYYENILNFKSSLPHDDQFDFNEELSGLHSISVKEQAEFTNDVIRFILYLYHIKYTYFVDTHHLETQRTLIKPNEVILLGHSMGGFVSRAMPLFDNYPRRTTQNSTQKDAINTVITLNSPHISSLIGLDYEIIKLYEQVNDYWRRKYGDGMNANPNLDVVLVSIMSGVKDWMIHSDLSLLTDLVSKDYGIHFYTTSIPFVWMSMNHDAILWCHSFIKAIVHLLKNLVSLSIENKATRENKMEFINTHLAEERPKSKGMKLSDSFQLKLSRDYFNYKKHDLRSENQTPLLDIYVKKEMITKPYSLFHIKNTQKNTKIYTNLFHGYHFIVFPIKNITFNEDDISIEALNAIDEQPFYDLSYYPYTSTPINLIPGNLLSHHNMFFANYSFSYQAEDYIVLVSTDGPLVQFYDDGTNFIPIIYNVTSNVEWIQRMTVPFDRRHLDQIQNREPSYHGYVEYDKILAQNRRQLQESHFLGLESNSDEGINPLQIKVSLGILFTQIIDINKENRSFFFHINLLNIDPRVMVIRALLVPKASLKSHTTIHPMIRLKNLQNGEVKYWSSSEKILLNTHHYHDTLQGAWFPGLPLWEISIFSDPNIRYELHLTLDVFYSLILILKRYWVWCVVMPFILFLVCFYIALKRFQESLFWPSLNEIMLDMVSSTKGLICIGGFYSLVFLHELATKLVSYLKLTEYQDISFLYHLSFVFSKQTLSGHNSPPYFVYLALIGISMTLLFCISLFFEILLKLLAILFMDARGMPFFIRSKMLPTGSLDETFKVMFSENHISYQRNLGFLIGVCLLTPHQYGFMVVYFLVFLTALRSKISYCYQCRKYDSFLQLGTLSMYNYQSMILVWFTFCYLMNIPFLLIWLRNLSVGWIDYSHLFNIWKIAPLMAFVLQFKNRPIFKSPLKFYSYFYPYIKYGLLLLIIWLACFAYQYTFLLYDMTNLCLGGLFLLKLVYDQSIATDLL